MGALVSLPGFHTAGARVKRPNVSEEGADVGTVGNNVGLVVVGLFVGDSVSNPVGLPVGARVGKVVGPRV